MYVFEIKKIKNLPKKAGLTKLAWLSASVPTRDGDTICMPLDELIQFFPINNERQFLLRVRDRAWFGGTDERPFLVEMEPEVIDIYINSSGKEEIFYQSLVPKK